MSVPYNLYKFGYKSTFTDPGLPVQIPGHIVSPVTLIMLLIWQIAAASCHKEYKEAVEAMSDVVDLAGCSSMATRFDLQDRIVSSLVHFLVVDRCGPALAQFVPALKFWH